MAEQGIVDIIKLRFLVGYLGEKEQANWWASSFLSPSSDAFLTPVFVKTSTIAQYHGVTGAAQRAHDEHIGVGRVFHLFRLPERMQVRLFETLRDLSDDSELKQGIRSRDDALRALKEIAGAIPELKEGPVQVGEASQLDGNGWLAKVAGVYCAAFQAGARAYPYLVDRAA